MDCSAFLNWSEDQHQSDKEKAVVFRSLVATVKSQSALDASLEAEAVKFLDSVDPKNSKAATHYLNNLESYFVESAPDFIQSIGVLLSSVRHVIPASAMKMLNFLMIHSSAKIKLALVKAALIPQIITTLTPQSFPLTDGKNIHVHLLKIIRNTLWLATPDVLAQLGIEDGNEQQAVHETILKQILSPCEKYIRHLCVNRFSIIDGEQSESFLLLLAQLLQICPCYQLILDFVLHMPVVLTIPSCLTSFETESSIWLYLFDTVYAQRKWNEKRGNVRQLGKTMHRMLRMEGVEDVLEAKLLNDRNRPDGRCIIDNTIRWNNQLGMNLPTPRGWDDLSPVSLDGRHTLLLLRRHSSIVNDTESLLFMLVDFRLFITLMLSSHPLPSLPPHSGFPSLEQHFGRRFGRIRRFNHRLDGRSRSQLPHHPHPPLCLSLTTHTLPLPSASPSPPTPSHSPLPLPHHPHPPTPLCLSLTTHTLPPLCLSLTTHTLPLPSASPSPPTPSHSPLPLPHHPHPPTLLCLSLTTHTFPLSSASPSPHTPSHSPLPLPHHPHPPLCLSLTTHTLPLPSASPSPPTPSHSSLPLPHHPHPPTPLCLSLTIQTLPLSSPHSVWCMMMVV
ncbi:hypothetical protein BLNAU_4767 [Blattamonas nauphoetae]|uniref:Uncharacterized protein n=1 Tax=Blattamonas nauphoetae TaxID=2049346 RepID=A0ABQ9Y977_9EUKA|nr:hypothetical protein BLNAU_4767 [Blattamonas nauphoetae]